MHELWRVACHETVVTHASVAVRRIGIPVFRQRLNEHALCFSSHDVFLLASTFLGIIEAASPKDDVEPLLSLFISAILFHYSICNSSFYTLYVHDRFQSIILAMYYHLENRQPLYPIHTTSRWRVELYMLRWRPEDIVFICHYPKSAFSVTSVTFKAVIMPQ